MVDEKKDPPQRGSPSTLRRGAGGPGTLSGSLGVDGDALGLPGNADSDRTPGTTDGDPVETEAGHTRVTEDGSRRLAEDGSRNKFFGGTITQSAPVRGDATVGRAFERDSSKWTGAQRHAVNDCTVALEDVRGKIDQLIDSNVVPGTPGPGHNRPPLDVFDDDELRLVRSLVQTAIDIQKPRELPHFFLALFDKLKQALEYYHARFREAPLDAMREIGTDLSPWMNLIKALGLAFAAMGIVLSVLVGMTLAGSARSHLRRTSIGPGPDRESGLVVFSVTLRAFQGIAHVRDRRVFREGNQGRIHVQVECAGETA